MPRVKKTPNPSPNFKSNPSLIFKPGASSTFSTNEAFRGLLMLIHGMMAARMPMIIPPHPFPNERLA